MRLALLLITLLVIAAMLRYARRVGSIALAVLLVGVLVLANLAAAANAYYDRYPTVDTLLAGEANELAGPAPGLPGQGQVVPVQIPGEVSGFVARQAQVYLPPAWFAQDRPQLPVVLLLPGAGGSPQEWIDDGGAAATADAFAANRDGQAPILVVPDVTGADGRARGCVDSPLGQVETYLTRDVPAAITRDFSAVAPGPGWAVAGHDAGGSCAIMLALRHPDLFGTFGDFGGLAGPRLGTSNTDVTTTLTELFDGDAARFGAHQPAQLLAGGTFPELGGWFQAGGEDTEAITAIATLVPLAQAAGVDTCLVVVPGAGAGPQIWGPALADALPWISARLAGEIPPPETTRDCGLLPGP